MSKNSAHIAKLTESDWIQEEPTANGRRNQILVLLHHYENTVSAIVMLRAFCHGPGIRPHRYELLEIPVSIFDAVQKAPLALFHRDEPEISCESDVK